MFPYQEPMTEKQLRYLRHLIHPSEWHKIDRNMTKNQASEQIDMCIRENQSDQAAIHALSTSPRLVWSRRHGTYIDDNARKTQPTLAEVLPPPPEPKPEPPKTACTRLQYAHLMSLLEADSSTVEDVTQGMTEAEIDQLIAQLREEKEREQEAARKAAEEKRARIAKEEEETARRWRVDAGLPAIPPPGEERSTAEQRQVLMNLIGGWALHYFHSLTKEEAAETIRRLTQPLPSFDTAADSPGSQSHRAFMNADLGDD